MTKSLLTSFIAIAGVSCLFFFTSTSTVKHSNSEAIEQLSEQLTAMNAELDELRNTECADDVWSEPTLGEVAMFAGNFAPRGWALCDGSILPISQHQALFSILGTTYGGDGRTTFALPDLRGRVAVHPGNGPGLNPVRLGQRWGQEQTYLTGVQTTNVAPPSGRSSVTVVSNVSQNGISVAQPSLAVNYIIALQGVYPSRN